MELSQKNEKGIQKLLSMGLFKNEDAIRSYATNYAFNIDSHCEETLDIDASNMKYLKDISQETGISISFLINAILRKYLAEEDSN